MERRIENLERELSDLKGQMLQLALRQGNPFIPVFSPMLPVPAPVYPTFTPYPQPNLTPYPSPNFKEPINTCSGASSIQ